MSKLMRSLLGLGIGAGAGGVFSWISSCTGSTWSATGNPVIAVGFGALAGLWIALGKGNSAG